MKNKFLIIFLVLITALTPISLTAFAASESTLKNEVVRVAENEVGYTGTSSYSKYGDWYGYQGSWCTTFLLWCYNKAGNNTDTKMLGKIVPSGGNCNSMISWFKDKGRYHKSSSYSPKKGDVVFFDWSGNGSSQHVGIVSSVSGSTVYTIEGNCSGKVKERSYTKSGSKPYNNISSIMGYGSPNYSSLSSSKATTKKATTKKATTTKKAATTKKSTTTKTAEVTTKSSTKTTEKGKTTTESTTKKTDKKTTTKENKSDVKSLKLYAASNTLEIGDSVDLKYTLSPKSATAVVGYFCDEEGIIEIEKGGKIKAIGNGKATVVVCANDELYSQYDFTVSDATSEVTAITPSTAENSESQTFTTERNAENVLSSLGVNVAALTENPKIYYIPLTIVGLTAFLSIIITIIRKIKKR